MSKRRPSLRPRQIDIHSNMRIITSEEDFKVEENSINPEEYLMIKKDETLNSTPTSGAGLVTESDNSQLLVPKPIKLKPKKQIPIPFTQLVKNYEREVPDDFDIPVSYVRLHHYPSNSNSSIPKSPNLASVSSPLISSSSLSSENIASVNKVIATLPNRISSPVDSRSISRGGFVHRKGSMEDLHFDEDYYDAHEDERDMHQSSISCHNNISRKRGRSNGSVHRSNSSYSKRRGVELDLDVEDMKWLENHPKYGENGDPRYQLSLSHLEVMLDILEKASGPICPSLVTLNEAEDLFRRKLKLVKSGTNKVTVDVYNYWYSKRSRLNKPILRKFWPQTPLNDTNPHLVFRPREKERYKLRKHRKNDLEGYRKLQRLRDELNATKELISLIRRREKIKRLLLAFVDEQRNQQLAECIHHALYSNSTKSDTSTSAGDELNTKKPTPNLRVPLIPMEDEVELKQCLLFKKKKKKKHKKGGILLGKKSENGVSNLLSSPSGSSSNNLNSDNIMENSSTSFSPCKLDKQKKKLKKLNFMQYQPRPSSSGIDDDHGGHSASSEIPDDTFSHFTPSTGFLPHSVLAPPRYRCRGRIGRGGRLIIDRELVHTASMKENWLRESYAPLGIYHCQLQPDLYTNKLPTSFSEEIKVEEISKEEDINKQQQSNEIIVIGPSSNSSSIHGLSTVNHPYTNTHTKNSSISFEEEKIRQQKLQAILNMSDSEEEYLEPCSFSNQSLDKQPMNTVSITPLTPTTPPSTVVASSVAKRPVKYTLDL